MASKRNQRRRACEAKRRYPDFDSAAVHARLLHHSTWTPVNVYRCERCGGWHVGHLPGWRSRYVDRRRRIQR